MVTRHLPGKQNETSHILSHLGEETRARHDYFTRYGTTVMACPATDHSFHGPPDPQENPLSPYQLVHLNLSAGDAAEMQRAYLPDDTPIQSVPLSDVYKVIPGHASQTSVPTLHRERINAWRNKRFFLFPLLRVTPPYYSPRLGRQCSSILTVVTVPLTALVTL